eukprot:TRINITY_DN57650_c0_g1_i1.p1 TRINITY_DN57650_c0_g1~~TRINITY_DN57650_c0_g1_i1.p1  ORF type:complete len:711 (+),score=116.34 TRINITY_DN57650_c0_g1_i1:93-2225(+)
MNAHSDPVEVEKFLKPLDLPEASAASVQRLYREVGYLVRDLDVPVLLADALAPDCPIIGASRGFEQLTGFQTETVLGQNCRFMLKDVQYHISASSRRSLRSMIRMCRLVNLSSMGTSTCMQMNRKEDGSKFLNYFAVCLAMCHDHPFLVGVQSDLGTEHTIAREEQDRVRDQHLEVIDRVKSILANSVPPEEPKVPTRPDPFELPCVRQIQGDQRFSALGIGSNIILLNDDRSLMRREALDIPSGCVAVGSQPAPVSRRGAFFALRVEGVLRGRWKNTWPVLGFTRVRPDEMAEMGYPQSAKTCAQSVSIGGEFCAHARQQETHHQMGFRPPRPSEILIKEGPYPRYMDTKGAPWDLTEGDLLSVLYQEDGHLHLMLNYTTVLSIDTGTPMEGDQYPLVDLCHMVYEVTLMPFENTVDGLNEFIGVQPKVDRMKELACASAQAAAKAMGDCAFAVTVADPSSPDVPLLAVSPAFEQMTGYDAKDILGINCRFLSQDCDMDLEIRAKLRSVSRTGQPFRAVLKNRRKNGELFANLLDVRGLKVAKDIETGEDIWYLIGIQCDVTNMICEDAEHFEDSENFKKMQLEHHIICAESFRTKLLAEFSTLALAAGRANSSAGVVNRMVVPAAEHVERGPKPPLVPPVMALASGPQWMDDAVVHPRTGVAGTAVASRSRRSAQSELRRHRSATTAIILVAGAAAAAVLLFRRTRSS